MNHDSDSATGGGRMTMHFFQTKQSPSWSASSTAADFSHSVPYSSICFTPSISDHSNSRIRTTSTTASSFVPFAGASCFGTNAAASDLSVLMMEHQDLLGRHKSCLSQQQKIYREAETLRQENTNLRVANGDLSNRLNRLVEAYLHSQYDSMMISSGPSSLSPDIVTLPLPSLTEKFGGLHVADKARECVRWESGESATGVIERDGAEKDVDRVSLPKSISVRSTGFLKVAGQVATNGTTTGPSREANRNRHSVPIDGPQKVYVRGNKKEVPIELEVHTQGTWKTELCNKWQETGSCVYGENCQFAHGLEELRPVLRHPRYKTEVCRMVLAGDPCPYGHRCHFRHALTEQEKLIRPLNLD